MSKESEANSVIPDRLYYYATESVVNGLWNEELKVSSPSDFDDPFEFLPGIDTSIQFDALRNFERFSEAVQAAGDGNLYALCLSRKPNDVRMWAQYGGNHAGIMLTLDITKDPLNCLRKANAIQNINYEEDNERYIVRDIDGNPCLERNLSSVDLEKLMLTKGRDWIQQEETRILITGRMIEGLGLSKLNGSSFGRLGLLNNRIAAFIKRLFRKICG